ncbi:MAG: YfiT family bacillithiol transferase [Bacteroidota bacterium]
MTDLRYPIGQVDLPDEITAERLKIAIEQIASLPDRMSTAIEGLSAKQLDTPYRPGGWTVRQVVHHVSESHMNGFIRCKWALTEDEPHIKAYNEKEWTSLADDATAPVAVGMSLLQALHQKWSYLYQHLTPEQWDRTYYHPEDQRAFTLRQSACVYAWHGNHHLAHITGLSARQGW